MIHLSTLWLKVLLHAVRQPSRFDKLAVRYEATVRLAAISEGL